MPLGYEGIVEEWKRQEADKGDIAKIKTQNATDFEFFMNQAGYRKVPIKGGTYTWEEIADEDLINFVGSDQAQQIIDNRTIDQLYRDLIAKGLRGEIVDPGFEARAKDLQNRLDVELFQRGQTAKKGSSIGREKNLDLFNVIENTRGQIARGNVAGYAGEQRIRDYGQDQALQNLGFNLANQRFDLLDLGLNYNLQQQSRADQINAANRAAAAGRRAGNEEFWGTVAGVAIPGLIDYLLPAIGSIGSSGGSSGGMTAYDTQMDIDLGG